MRAEDVRADKTRPFTGEEYLASLRDGRAGYLGDVRRYQVRGAVCRLIRRDLADDGRAGKQGNR